jgi:alpha-glucosidase (family GH31 glycosyl hydrolase)
VWPGDAAYPDFMNDKTVSWWKTQLSNFFNNVNFDGLWLDMNEASNFCNGACYNGQVSPNPIIN